ncbi:13479_t:CDS:2 [Rhizophagus irregularis]|nr:13479_t:CDS:2 [Rhizophagus irregularis]
MIQPSNIFIDINASRIFIESHEIDISSSSINEASSEMKCIIEINDDGEQEPSDDFIEIQDEEEKENLMKSKHWWQNVLPFYDITQFKKILRMHPHSFQQLANLIQSHHVFSSQGNKPQACIEFQLAVFLCQLGSSTGSLFEQKKEWPTSEEHKKVNEGFENLGGLKNVIGAVDGTYIPMRNAPNKDPEVYFTRKKCYAIHCQDYSHLIQDDDYLLGNSAYPISPFLIPPFKDLSSRKHKKFNQFHSRH